MKKLFPILIMIVAVAGGLWLGTIFNKAPETTTPSLRTISQQTQALVPPKPVQPFQLTNHLGMPFDLNSLKHKWTFMFFGYTHCPDVCPTTLQVLADVDRRLAQTAPELQKDTQVVFVSVDPARDSTAQLARYVPYFDKSFIGATGKPEQIKQLTTQLGIIYMQVKSKDSTDYLVDHSASVLLFDPDAHLHAIFSAPHAAERMLGDYIKLRRSS